MPKNVKLGEDAPIQVVWFKRDLRLHDHAPLHEASHHGPCLGLYVYEPELFLSPEFDSSHLVFINEALAELIEGFAQRGGIFITRQGALPEVFEQLRREFSWSTLWSHEETGNAITYRRDLRVAEWCQARGVVWRELPQTGVVRRLKSRTGWAGRWEARMKQPELPIPTVLLCSRVKLKTCGLISASEMGLEPSTKVTAQPGGETNALTTLNSFLQERGTNYRKEMSSPLSGEMSCSRISPYLAWGCISMKTVYHATEARQKELRGRRASGESIDSSWLGSLHSFAARLRWHCHFMQKLEDEPAIEFENMCRAYDGLREPYFDETRFAAWCKGRTGYPLVDACMRALLTSGWINFRMRAMLVSFASYHLWLHWRPTAVFLARHFLDFEPGIHFSQFQMQSGTTGINTVRIYSPIKQVIDQDPQGIFIKRHLPELARVPLAYIAEPHKMPSEIQREVGCVIGRDYPAPIVEHATAYRLARERISAVRRQDQARLAAQEVFRKHGSRKRSSPAQSKSVKRPKKASSPDLGPELFDPLVIGTAKVD